MRTADVHQPDRLRLTSMMHIQMTVIVCQRHTLRGRTPVTETVEVSGSLSHHQIHIS